MSSLMEMITISSARARNGAASCTARAATRLPSQQMPIRPAWNAPWKV
ncbi:hypothetical protein ACU4GH_18745 [Bradyrhizobium betae]